MCFHVWNFYQRHTWSSLVLAASPFDKQGSFRLLLHLPSCSPHACVHHSARPASPLYREFSARKGQLPVEVNLFGMVRTVLALDYVV